MNATGQCFTALMRTLSGGALLSLLVCSCSGADSDTAGQDIVAQVGTSALTRQQLRKAMPAGISSADSARFVKAYVSSWLESNVISEFAAKEVDTEDIERMVDDYRRSLIMREYSRMMFETHAAAIPEDSVRAYYDAHRDDFKLDRPMVKGTYLKVVEGAANLPVVRRLYASEKPEDADRLEKEVLSMAIHYDYFRDRWVDWEQIESRIPYDFGTPSSVWVEKGKKLDYTAGGFTYLLAVSDVLPAGSPMPFEAASGLIRTRMLNSSRQAYENALKRDLLQRALDRGTASVNIEL